MPISILLSLTTASLADPAGSSVFVAATQWLEGTLLGTIATTVAVISVGSVGLLALTGRIAIRQAAIVVFGCFILFGASSIAAGIQAATRGAVPGPGIVAETASPLTDLPRRSPDYDPYAGAAVPTR